MAQVPLDPEDTIKQDIRKTQYIPVFAKTVDGKPLTPEEAERLAKHINSLPEGKIGPMPRPESASQMSLRDFFAAKAMQALVNRTANLGKTDETQPDKIAELSYKYADAMLYWREKH